MWPILILTSLLAVFCLTGTSHAKGGGSKTVDAVGPKSERLINLENQFYDLADMTMGAYTSPLNAYGQVSAAPAASAGTAAGGTSTAGSVSQDKIVNAGKGAAAAPAATAAAGGTASAAGTGTGLAALRPAPAGAGSGEWVRVPNGFENKNGHLMTDWKWKPSEETAAPAAAAAPAPAAPVPTLSLNGLSIPQPYDGNTLMGQLFNDATKKTYVANQQYDDLVQQAPQISSQISGLLGQGVDAVNQSKTAGDWYFDQAKGDYGNAQKYLAQAGTAGDEWYERAAGAYGSADSLLGQLQNNLAYTREGNEWYDDYTRGMLGRSQNLLDTGEIPQPIMDAMLSAMTQGVNQSVGANVNDLASRGVLNSSVTNRALSDASRSVSDSMNANYLNAFDTILGGINDTARAGAEGGKAFSDVNFQLNNNYQNAMDSATRLGESYGLTGSRRVGDLLGVAQGYTGNADSLMDAGSQRIDDWLNIGTGYNDAASGYGKLLDSNLAQREALQNDLSGYYANAAAPMTPAYSLLQTMQQDHWNSDKKDTIVKQGK